MAAGLRPAEAPVPGLLSTPGSHRIGHVQIAPVMSGLLRRATGAIPVGLVCQTLLKTQISADMLDKPARINLAMPFCPGPRAPVDLGSRSMSLDSDYGLGMSFDIVPSQVVSVECC